MARVKSGVVRRSKHKKVLQLAKGYRGARSRTYKVAKQAVMRAGQYAYRDRRTRKRDMRSLWIMRINAAARNHNMSYSRFMNALKMSNIDLDRKMLAALALEDENAFAAIVAQINTTEVQKN